MAVAARFEVGDEVVERATSADEGAGRCVYVVGVRRTADGGFECRLSQSVRSPDDGWVRDEDLHPCPPRPRRHSVSSSLPSSSSSLATPQAKRRKSGNAASASASKMAENGDVAVLVPLPLRERMVADWHCATVDRRFAPLPRKPNVRAILSQFAREQQLPPLCSSEEVLDALTTYIDRQGKPLLLYKEERAWHAQQMAQAACKDRALSEVHGVEMLLRCIVRLPALAAGVRISEDAIPAVVATLSALLDFLLENAGALNSV